jgi:hypothetical protein
MSGALEALQAEQRPVPCPFPPCMARIVPVVQRTDPQDASKFTRLIPIHEVEGNNSWFGRCPASQFRYPELTDRAKQHLAEALAAFSRQVVERVEGRTWEPLGPWTRPPAEGTPTSEPTGKPRPSVENDAYFPPRPADSEGAPMGETNVSSRADLKGMIAAAVQAGGELQEAAATVTEHLEKAAALIEVMAEKQQIAAAMMVGAVGSDTAAPVAATEAVQGYSRCGEVLIDLRGSLALAVDRNTGAGNSARLAGLKALEYAARV